MSNRRFNRALSMLLTFTLVFTLLPWTSFSIPAVRAESPAPTPGLPVPQELEMHRTEKSERFLNPDGSLTEKIYLEPIHYRDEKTKKWEKIDSNLLPQQDGKLKNKANRFSVQIPDSAGGEDFLDFTKDDASLSFKPLFSKKIKGDTKGKKIRFAGIGTHTDLLYESTNIGLKETIVIRSALAPNTYSYEVKMKNLSMQIQEDNSIHFFKAGTKDLVFEMQKPYLTDANQNILNARYQLRKKKANDNSDREIVDLVFDADWLKKPERAFPVELDPSVVVKDDPKVDDTHIASLDIYGTYAHYSHNYVGKSTSMGKTRALYWFELPPLPTSAEITSATLNLTNTKHYVTTQTPTIEAHRINQDWYGTGVTWDNQPTIGGIDGTYTVTNQTTPAKWNIPLTNLVASWYNGTVANYGVMLKYSNEELVTREILATNSTDVANHPSLTVNYQVDGLGQQPFWTFEGPVNMGNRNLVFSDVDIDFPGRRVALSLERTYNSRSASSGIFGYGWSSPLDARLYVPAWGPARLVDGDGTVHYFAQTSNGTYASPPGLFWSLDVSGTTATVTTTDYTQYTFTSGRLTKVKDAAGNTVTYTLTNNQVTAIKDDAGNSIAITYYSNGKVYTAVDPAGRTWYYGYDTNGDLFRVTAPDGKATHYRYIDHNLVASVSPTGKTTYYAYEADDRLAAINAHNGITNANFEVDSDGDGLPDHYSYFGGHPGVSLDAASGSVRGQAIKVVSASSNAAPYTIFVSDPISVDPARTYTVSGDVKAAQTSGSQTTTLSMLAYDASGTSLGEVGRTALSGPLDWQRISGSGTLPAGTKTVAVRIGASNGTGVGSSWFDAVQIEASDTATDFVSGNQFTASIASSLSARYDGEGKKQLYSYNADQNITKMQQDPAGKNLTETYGWSTTSKNTMTAYSDPNGNDWSFTHDPNSGNVVTATNPLLKKQQFAWDAKSNLTKYTDVKGQSYNMTYDLGKNNLTTRDPYFTSTARQHDNYGNIVRETNRLGWADNLIDNSSFEGAVQSNGLPVHLTLQNGQGDIWSLTSGAVYGKKALTLNASNTNSAAPYSVITFDPVAVNPANEFVLSGYLKAAQTSGSQNTVFSIYAYNASDVYLGEVGRLSLFGAFDWQRWRTAITPGEMPSGTAKIRVKVGTSNGSGSGTSSFDAIQFQQNPVDTDYNMTDNSSFERGTTAPDNWLAPAGAKWETATVYAGARAVSIANITGWGGYTYNEFIPYDSTKDYNLTAFMKTAGLTANVAHIKIDFYDAAKKLIGQVNSPMIGGTKDWQRQSAELLAGKATAGTAFIRPSLMSGSATGTVYFDNVRLQIGRETTQYAYNSTNTWSTGQTNALGYTTSFEHDAAGNVTKETSPKLHVKEFKFDSMDRLEWSQPPGNEIRVSNVYDASGNITAIKQASPDGSTVYNTLSVEYDSSDQVKSISDSSGFKVNYDFTPTGNLRMVDNGTGLVSYRYDTVDRLTDVLYGDTTRYSFIYDSNENIKTVRDLVQNRTWTSTYDVLDRLTSWNDGRGNIAYTLDDAGNVTQEILTAGGVARTRKMSYNKVNQPSTLTDADGRIHSFLFNENRQMSVLQLGNGIHASYGYDPVGHVQTLRNQAGNGTVVSSYSYAYDPDGNTSSVTDTSGNTRNYTYSARGQLLTEELPNGNLVTYTYHPLGNRTSRKETKQDGSVVKQEFYGYDPGSHNRLMQVGDRVWTYDASGKVTSNGIYDFAYDENSRLTEVRRHADQTVVAYYGYDNANRRVYQKVDTEETWFLYNGRSNQVYAELDANNAIKKYYNWSPLGQLLSLTVGGTTYFAVHNGHGDIVQLTDANGAVAATYDYDAWGNLISPLSDIGALNPYRYAGYRADDVSGLYYLMARYYDPGAGRFLSPDPSTLTLDYSYAANNPLAYVDQDGQWLLDAVFVVADVISFVKKPSWSGAAWIALDVVSTVIPVGSISTVAHAAKAAYRTAHAAETARYVGRADNVISKARSGASNRVPTRSVRTNKSNSGGGIGKSDSNGGGGRGGGGWDMPIGGSTIHGRRYTQHALERMAPDTPQVRAELSGRAIAKGYQRGSKEFKDYVNPRNIPPMAVEAAIQSGTRVQGESKHGPTWEYTFERLEVSTNLNGDVITVHKRS